ncbi:MAG: sugar phosphate isomerase/epimerase family protein [Limisphaerales bacterium]
MNQPILRHIANLWTLVGHPSPKRGWTLEKKLRAIKRAEFDGVCWAGSSELRDGCKKHGLIFVSGMASGNAKEFTKLLADLKKFGAYHVNVQLAGDELLMPEAMKLALALNREGKWLGLEPAIESHRGTCMETPEKMYALADVYQKETGELLPISWDFSHFAVVKHLVPENFEKRLLVRSDLIQRAQQFHFRPFNGHHVQVPITNGKGNLTQEFKDWLPFAEALLKCWLDGNKNSAREIFICPELGPIEGGYALSTFPNSWEDAKILRGEIDKLWKSITT